MKSGLYFAYGSNLHPQRLARRVPSCAVVGQARLPGHQLRFHKLSYDGSGKCDAYRTGNPDDTVFGAIFKIDFRDKPALDRAEALGCGYDEHELKVQSGDGEVEVFTYLADPLHIRPNLAPFTWYRQLIVQGARFHRLPQAYIAEIEAQPAIPDPDPGRAASHEELLRRIRSGGD